MDEKNSRGLYIARKSGLAEPVATSLGETAEAFAAHRQAFIDNLEPKDAIQAALVDDIASCTWRIGRLRKLEAKHLQSQANDYERLPNPLNYRDPYEYARELSNARLVGRWPLEATVSSKMLALIERQEDRLRAAWQKSLRLLLQLQEEATAKPKGERKTKKAGSGGRK